MKRNLKVLQEEISDCGVCSLLSIIRYYGGDTNLEKLRIETSTTKKGVSAYNLIECAINYGFDAKGLKVKDLNKINYPCIAHIKINNSLSHFIVLYKLKNDVLTIMDPSSGFKNMKVNEFNKCFTGVVILLSPKTIIKKETSDNYLLKRILFFISKNKKIISLIVFFNLLFVLLSIVNGFYIELFNIVSNTKIIYFIFLILTIIISFLNYIISLYHEKLKKNVNINILKDFYKHILNLPLKYIHLKDSSEIIKRINDLEGVETVIVDAIVIIFTNFVILSICQIIIFFISKPVFIIINFFTSVYIFVSFILNKNIITLLNQVIDVSTKYNSKLIDNVLGLTSIHHNYLIDHSLLTLSKVKNEDLNTYYLYNKKLMKNNNILDGLFRILLISVYTYVFMSNKITLSILIVLSFIINLINDSLKSIAAIIPGLFYTKSIIRKIDEFYSINLKDNGYNETNTYDIEVNNLSFGYNSLYNIISNLDLKIKKGEKVIIKGESGKGKSTFCRILNKELNYKGSIKIGDVELSTLSSSNLKTQITYSSQDEYIFNASIKDNILLGRKVSDEDFNKIASICCLDRIIKNRPFKYDTYLYDGGKELSGGERNLIILARTLINKSNIYIFDETLKELNDSVENEVLKNIFENFKDKTIIYVSHKNKKNYFGRVIYV
ncbi:MAG: ATP-binding cassette domain-containing protein [Bacilli bacterium]|nr:ATP-binding cassette domain-containing protein [Bacilli bacterium]